MSVPYATLTCQVIGATTLFMVVITAYLFVVRDLNKKLSGTPEQQAKVLRSGGVTQQMVDLGWRYVGY